MIERNATATYTGKDQSWQDQTTTYWFDVEAADGETEQFGIVEHNGGEVQAVEYDGAPVQNELLARRLIDGCVVTDEMRAE